MISINERALEIVRRMIADAEALSLAATTLPNGATVLDAGLEVTGSLEAGRLFAEVCLADSPRSASANSLSTTCGCPAWLYR